MLNAKDMWRVSSKRLLPEELAKEAILKEIFVVIKARATDGFHFADVEVPRLVEGCPNFDYAKTYAMVKETLMGSECQFRIQPHKAVTGVIRVSWQFDKAEDNEVTVLFANSG